MPLRLPPLYLLCQLCLRIWLWGLAYIEVCKADSKLADRVANDCLAPRHIWWQKVNSNSLKVTGTLPEENVWSVWFALKPGPDKRCFCLRLNSSLEMWKGLIIHKAEMGWHWTESGEQREREYLESTAASLGQRNINTRDETIPKKGGVTDITGLNKSLFWGEV